MYCKNCGKELSKEDKFCTECGTKVKKETKKTTTKEKEEVVNTVPVNKSKGIASLVIGIISFTFAYLFFPLPIVGLVLGISQKGNYGEKIAGIVLNAISLVFSTIMWLVIILFVFYGSVSSYEAREESNGNSDIIVNDNTYNVDYIDLFD